MTAGNSRNSERRVLLATAQTRGRDFVLRSSLLACTGLSALTLSTEALAQTTNGAQTPPASLSEIVVTGTSIRGIAPTGSAPISVDRKAIDVAAPRTTADLLATVPQIAQFNAVPTGGSTFGSVVAQVSLRPNLGAGATLALVNGHRIVPSGILQGNTDTSILPPAAIARVEVIADGASAIYGSDAVGGVINFIMRKTFEGNETAVRYSTAQHDYSGYDLSHVFGKSWSTGSFVVSGEYLNHTRLEDKNLNYYTNVGTVSPGLSTTCPVATVGPSPIKCDAAKWGDLQPKEQRGSIFASGRQQLSSGIEAWADLIYSDDRRDQNDAQAALPSTVMAAGNPFNTSGVNQTIFYRPNTEFTSGQDRALTMTVAQITGGLDFSLPGDWKGTAFAGYGQSKNRDVAVGTDNVAYQQAMAATTRATAFDPFGHQTSASVLAQILDATDVTDVTLKLTDFVAKVDGSLFSLPAGKVRLAAGVEAREEAEVGYRRVGDANSILGVGLTGLLSQGNANAKRDINSLLAEVYVPIVGTGNSIPLVKSLSLSVAGRYDHYSDVGGTTNPKFGVNWQVIDDIRLFGTVSSSFQAPQLGNTLAGAIDTRIQTQFGGSPFQPSGPGLAAYAGTNGLVIAGGSGNLVPQTSKNYSFGAEFVPREWSGFRAKLNYYNVDFRNFIGLPFPGTYTIPSLAQYGIVAPIVNGAIVPFTASSPQVTQFTSKLPVDGLVLPSQIYWISVLQRVNLSRRIQGGVDFDVSQSLPLANGILTGRVAGTYITGEKLAGSPGAAFTDVLSTDNKLRYAASVDYQLGGLAVGGVFNHLDGRYSSVAQTVPIKAFDLVNLHALYAFDIKGILEGVQLSLNVDNLLDKAPPRQADAVGNVVANLDPFGRMVSVGIRKHW